ncbi:integral membrane protein-like protein [Aureobasidium pullulans]|nr:integral membrane protein-like protein [Aureobasidium pullulans]
MRPTALIPVIFGLAAFVLTMLCIFAGSKKDFMQEYAIVTLNTSRIGTNVFNTTSSTDSDSNIFESIWDNVTNSIESSLNDKINSFAQDLGLHDFYSAHLLDYCSGYYTPTDLPNATFSKSDIDQNITYCSNRTSFFRFNPTTALEQELNKTGLNITLEDLHWPEAVNDGVHALRVAQKAAFLLYCIAAGLLLLHFRHERKSRKSENAIYSCPKSRTSLAKNRKTDIPQITRKLSTTNSSKPDKWPTSITTESAPTAFPSRLRDARSEIQVLSAEDRETWAMTTTACPQCANPEMRFRDVQLRGADEGSTIFYRCPKCDYKFNTNN